MILVWMVTVPLLAQQADRFKTEKERALGEKMAENIMLETKPFAVPEIQNYARSVGNRLTSQLEGAPAYRFEVVAYESFDPIPLPGRFVVIPARFFLMARNESEFAGMLAHAIGHVEMRHGWRTTPAGNSGMPVIFTGGWSGSHAPTAGASMLMPLGFLKTQRDNELLADQYGAELASKAGFDWGGIYRYLQRLQSGDTDPEGSSLPPKEDRLAVLAKIMGGAPAEAPSDEEFSKVQEAVRRAIAPPPKRPPTLRR